MDAHAYLAYGVILEGDHDWKKIQDAVGAECGEENEDEVAHLSLGDYGGDAIVFNPSVESVYDGVKEIDPEALAGFDHGRASKAIAKVLKKLGHKPAKPKWLLMACYY